MHRVSLNISPALACMKSKKKSAFTELPKKKKEEENHLYVPHIVKIKISLMGYNLTFFILMF